MRRLSVLIFVLTAGGVFAPSASLAGPCGILMSPEMQARAKADPLFPSLAETREVILSLKSESPDRDAIACDGVVSKGAEGDGFVCYHGNSVFAAWQAARPDSDTLLKVSMGDKVRSIAGNGRPTINGRMGYPRSEGVGVTALRTKELFCEAILSGSAKPLLSPIHNDGSRPGEVVPAVYYGPSPEEDKEPIRI